MSNSYQPSAEILDKYAQVLVNYALNSGQGVKAGEVVQVVVPDVAKPLALALQNTLLKSGAHPMIRLLPTGFDKDFYELASDAQLEFFPKKYFRARVDVIDHQIVVIADPDPRELQGVDPRKIFQQQTSKKLYRQWLTEKETANKFTWTIGLWGVPAKAKEVGLSLEKYWQQIIQACFLDTKNPIAEWRKVQKLQQEIMTKLNALPIETIQVIGPDVDLKLLIGPNRRWIGGSGRNIPSFELFTSPDWRGTNGWIRFNQPLYRYGNVIEGVELRFRNGLVTHASARKGGKILKEMIAAKDANKVGEFSLTDKRMSRITHVMAETLFDENIGGPYGNTHLAVGMSYQDTYNGDSSKVSKSEWKKMGFNDSVVHTDIISTTDRTVTATLKDGSTKVIYKNGRFVV